jgi:hypothetical protein
MPHPSSPFYPDRSFSEPVLSGNFNYFMAVRAKTVPGYPFAEAILVID